VKLHRRRGKKQTPTSTSKSISREGDRVGSLKRVWRRETLCTLEGRIARCPNTGKEESTPSERARCGYTLRQSSWQTSVGFILVCIACGAGLSRKETRAHPGRCGRVEIGRKGERVGPLSTIKSRETRSSLQNSESDTVERVRGPPRLLPHKGESRAASVGRKKRQAFCVRTSRKRVRTCGSDESESVGDGPLGRTCRRQYERERQGRSRSRSGQPEEHRRARSASSALKRRSESGAPRTRSRRSRRRRTAALLTVLLPRERVADAVG
jgi:hypothetical protein